jgi:hypothetical protein
MSASPTTRLRLSAVEKMLASRLLIRYYGGEDGELVVTYSGLWRSHTVLGYGEDQNNLEKFRKFLGFL